MFSFFPRNLVKQDTPYSTAAQKTSSSSTEKKNNGTFFYIPPNIDPQLIGSNNELLSSMLVSLITMELKSEQDGYFPKEDLQSQKLYDAIKDKNEIYLIYDNNEKEFKAGEGGYGNVQYVKKLGGEWSALKTLKKRESKEKDYAEKEHKTLLAIKKTTGSLFTWKNYQEETEFGFILSLAKGHTLRKFIEENKINKKSIIFRLIVAFEIINKVKELHSLGYLHRDIKEDNIMIYYHPTKNIIEIELIDYGFAVQANSGIYRAKKRTGSQTYMAPEIEKKLEESEEITYSEKTEMFAIGNLLNKFLFPDDFTQNGDILGDFKNILISMKNEDPTKRPTIKEAINSLSSTLIKLEKDENIKQEYNIELNIVCALEKNRLESINDSIKSKQSIRNILNKYYDDILEKHHLKLNDASSFDEMLQIIIKDICQDLKYSTFPSDFTPPEICSPPTHPLTELPPLLSLNFPWSKKG